MSAEHLGKWVVRSFEPGKSEEPFSVEPYASEEAAREDYDDRVKTLQSVGGGAELIDPDGLYVTRVSKRMAAARAL